MVAPWSGFWDRNMFLEFFPGWAQLFDSPFVRGAVSGVGAITVLAGLTELVGVLSLRQRPKQDASRVEP